MEDLMADIAEYLQQEQEMYGSLPFPASDQKGGESTAVSRIKSKSNPEDKEPEKSSSAPAGEGLSEMNPEFPKAEEKESESASVGATQSVSKKSEISETTPPDKRLDELSPAVKQPEESLPASVTESASKSIPREKMPLTLENRLEQVTTLEELKRLCEESDELKTDLAGTNLVFGVGNPIADLMLIGEAPGEQEDRQGEPFVGAAGQLLNKILAAIQFNREDVYIANILKHRPPGNRNPSPEERLRSLPYLLKQIDLIQPKLILCLGKVSGTTLLNREDSLKNLRGQFYPFRNSLLAVTYHPAALLRNPQWKRPTWEDVQKVRAKYNELTNS